MCYSVFYLSADGFLFVRVFALMGLSSNRNREAKKALKWAESYKEVPKKWLKVRE